MRTLSIRPHNSVDYAGLRHIDNYTSLSEREEACLKAVGKVLCDRGVNRRLGVSRLHHHFSVYDNERMVERLFPDKGEQVVSPEPYDDKPCDGKLNQNDLLPTVFMFEAIGVGEQGLVALEYASASTVGALSDAEKGVLAEVGVLIKEMGCEKHLGICIRHGDLQGEKQMTLLEVTDEAARRNVCRLAPMSTVNPETTTETRWFFAVPEGYGSMGCAVQPTRVCVRYCTTNQGSGHGGGHASSSGNIHRWCS